MPYFDSHAFKGLLFIAAAAFLLAWPPALPWIAAVALLQLGVKQITLAFKETERDVSLRTGITEGGPALPAPDDGGRLPARPVSGALPARSQV